MVDVTAEIQIAAEPTDVASVMFDPEREPEWIAIVKRVELIDRALRPGARVRRSGTIVGHEFQWTTEVSAFHFPHLLTLRVVDGPFPGELTYQIQRDGRGSVARIRSRGETADAGLSSAMIEGPLRTALDADLGRLKSIVEGTSSGPPGGRKDRI